MNISYIVYKTTNIINGKVYVGVHKMDLDKPDSYIGCGINKKDRKKSTNVGFPAAVHKYGYENFKREILFTFPYTDEGMIAAYAKEAEIVNDEWVKSDKNYNLTIGGKFTPAYIQSKEINQYAEDGKFIKTWPSALIAANELGFNAAAIRKNCRNKRGIYMGFQWRDYEGNIDNIAAYKYKTIYQYDLSGNLIKVWKSITEASKIFPKPSSAAVQIQHVISPKHKDTQAFGFYWNNKRKFEYTPPKDRRTAVACYTKTGKFVQSFSSLADAAKYYNISAGNICGVLKGVHKTCNNLRWRYFYGNKSNITPLT